MDPLTQNKWSICPTWETVTTMTDEATEEIRPADVSERMCTTKTNQGLCDSASIHSSLLKTWKLTIWV